MRPAIECQSLDLRPPGVAAHGPAQDDSLVDDPAVRFGPELFIEEMGCLTLHAVMGTEEGVEELVAVPGVVDGLPGSALPDVVGPLDLAVRGDSRELKEDLAVFIPEVDAVLALVHQVLEAGEQVRGARRPRCREDGNFHS